MRVGIALGSNLGDRHALITKAIDNLHEIHEGGPYLRSSFYETEPEDCTPDSPRFLNAAVELETQLEPTAVLDLLQELEIASGRPKDHQFHTPRLLDLDLLYCDTVTLDSVRLQLPHPRIRERLFVLLPLSEIRPDLKLPGWSINCKEYLQLRSNNSI
jgi:2-amino-4-hydroxy-6-hydroxymethyldihydropteridine diphosphokinase